MTLISLLRQRVLACLSLVVPVLAVAQTSPQQNAASAPGNETVILSPFVVDAATDEGYRATSTLAGNRIKTDLKDVAASVSVLTTDFLDDLGANDVASAMAFVAGAENDSTYHQENIASLGGNNGYVGGDFGDNNTRSGEVRVRGLGRATNTINFIEVIGSTDRYNTERTEFLRGANSILFGLAEPAGLVNSSTKVANILRDFTRVETKFDNFGSNRVVLDINRALIDRKLALRVVALHNDQHYKVKTAFHKDRRLFLTSTYQPTPSTTIRAYYEAQNTDGRRPNFRTTQDNVSQWLEAYNTYAPQMTQAQIDAAFFWDPLVPNADGLAPATIFTLANGTTVNLGKIRRPLDTANAGTYLIYPGNGQWGVPLDNRITLTANRTVTNGQVAPTSRSQFARSGDSRENNDMQDGRRADPQVTDQGIFPYETVEIAALPGSYRRENDHKINVTVDQRITDDLYVSATVQRETRNHEQYFATITQTNQIAIDINKNLPDGRVNPNFLRPFISGRSGADASDLVYTNYLLQANYDFDFARKTERLGWLGSHRLGAVYSHAKRDTLSYRFQSSYLEDAVGLSATSYPVGHINRSALQMWYVGDPVQLGDTALRFTGFPDTLAAPLGQSFDYLYFNNLATPASWQLSPDKLTVGRSIINNAAARTYSVQTNTGIGTSLQSFFWDSRIVTLFGWRKDTVDSFLGVLRPNSEFPFPDLPGDERGDFQPTGTNVKFSRASTTQSIVFKVNDSVRLLANRSENFAATAPRLDNLYRSIPPQSGKTEEAGVAFTLLDNKLDVKLTYFKSSQLFASSSSGVASLRIHGMENAIYNALELAGRLSEWSTIGVNGSTVTTQYATPNNANATETSVSEGYGLEVAYQPSRNWDFVFSVDKIDNISTGINKELFEFFALRAPFYKKYFDEGLRRDGSNNTAPTTSPLVQAQMVTLAGQFTNELLREGTTNRGLAPLKINFVGRYKFYGGPLNGLSIGTALRWEDKKLTGYGQKDGVFNIGGLENYTTKVPDVTVEYWTGSVISGGMFASYSRRIYNGRLNWKIQLNADNIFSETGLRPIGNNSDGSSVWGIFPHRTYSLSNTFEF